jgi:hypothetical protein
VVVIAIWTAQSRTHTHTAISTALLSKKRPPNNPTFLKIFLARLNPAGALRQSARALELSIALVHEERRDRALGAPGRDYHRQLILLWQIYSRCVLAQICFRQCGHRCGGGRAMSATMA